MISNWNNKKNNKKTASLKSEKLQMLTTEIN